MENIGVAKLIKQAEALHPTIKVRMSLDLVDPQLMHFHIQNETGTIRGFGSGFSKQGTFIKAYAEYIERAAFRNCAQSDNSCATSSGFAAHVSLEEAAEAATCEMVERDAFLCCWLTGRNPYWLQSTEITQALFSDYNSVCERFRLNNLDIKLGIVAKTGLYYVAIGMILPASGSPRDFGFVIDTAASRKLQDALFAVYQGCCRHATLCLNRRKSRQRLFAELDTSMLATPSDHLEYYLNPANTGDELLASSAEITTLTMPSCEIQQCEACENILDLKVVRCVGKEFQEYFVGPTQERFIKHARLKREFNEYQLNWRVHPLP